jgi:hypothetical protein
MSSAVKNQIEHHADEMLELVKQAIGDGSSVVREAAAEAFDGLQMHLGSRAIDGILPQLLATMQSAAVNSESHQFALEALKSIMEARSHVVFPILMPDLLKAPITEQRAQALATLLAVAGTAVNRRLQTIINALIAGLEQNDEAKPAIEQALRALMGVINDDGVYQLMMHLHELVKEGPRRQSGLITLAAFFDGNQDADLEEMIPDWIKVLIGFLDSDLAGGEDVMKAAWRALDAMMKRIPKDDMPELIPTVRRALNSLFGAVSKTEIDAFNLPKGLGPFVPVFLQGLMNGEPDIRQQSAETLGQIITRCNADGLKPFVVMVAGALIRLVGEKLPWQIKVPMLNDLS